MRRVVRCASRSEGCWTAVGSSGSGGRNSGMVRCDERDCGAKRGIPQRSGTYEVWTVCRGVLEGGAKQLERARRRKWWRL
jgi:hypothetical protein